MVGFGNKYIAAQFGISPGLAATVNASVLIAALIGGLLANRVINRFGQKRAFIIGMGLCTIGAAAVAIAPSIWWVLVCRVIMGFGLGIDFPLATNAVAELRGSTSKKTGTSVNLWQMAWYVSTTVVYPQCGPHASGVTRKHATFWENVMEFRLALQHRVQQKQDPRKKQRINTVVDMASYLMIVTANAPSLAVSWQPCRRGNITP